MARIYYDKDADLSVLRGKTVAIVGYGIQGRGQALNLRDSGVNVIVAQRPGGPNYALAEQDGFTPLSAASAAAKADLIMLLAQDMLQGQIYREAIAPHLKAGRGLGFSHGFAILYRLIEPPKSVDVFLVAPKGPGSLVRSQYLEGKGVPALVAVHQDATGRAKPFALAWAKGIGATRAGTLETTFKEETETDNFGEQAVLCGGVSALIKAGFETLVEAGYQPELAYFECLHELKLITDMIYAGGIQGMRKRVSDTAKWGDVKCGPRIIDERVKETMRQLLREIQSGQFAKEWIAEHEAGRPDFTRLMQQDEVHPIEQVGRKLRAMMPWIGDQRQATSDKRQVKKRTQDPRRKTQVRAKRRRTAARSRS
ncbi:MAG TPA: ketol-acid reductoisomerase [Candidatus Omnitrophica bacterium]|nr:MAG: ketol-acid reductoisomerase [Omnitrophica WOR_2 bacterium GWA2_63_20]OGX18653.1 MAG: ketol-acid reductoisomerase [Omnitrophica WOR_2 bacterium GWF2_63_9]OGX32264.1 MAG: ketol-acid reductoisomerase [Omnitrophica WOR_2 bacterium RIFCSPHIGHO2_12_FULL_64_13]OGX35410.1 MAG: ketol-acid reductoisomerase [Omnitrophica WOR_2 bacterium RIFCSPHIGHO2_02_FULL_63_39]OGX45422.1 MAG: ketol-acid reductoisomerase [Omnitrophica WOR_2 bacterium RIFCSPLOWO2_02_FULL_63_16]HAM41289.1 ketol-acid reductoisomer